MIFILIILYLSTFLIKNKSLNKVHRSSLKSYNMQNPGFFYSCNHQKLLSYPILDDKTLKNANAIHKNQSYGWKS